AALIFQHSVGLLPEFPVTQTTVKKTLQKRTTFTLPVAHLTTQIENGANNEFKCTVIGSNLKGFVAGEFSIGYDPSVVMLSRGSITTSVRGATLNSRIDPTNKLLKVAIVTNDDIDENNPVPLMSITLPPAQGNTEKAFSIIEASINEGKIPTNLTSTSTIPNITTSNPTVNHAYELITRGNRLIVNINAHSNTTGVTIWTLNGKCLFYKNVTSNASYASLTIDRLPPGSYLYKIKSGTTMNIGKFVITY
ncbi:MAG TPA: T9SS type A sorting domain-containing protein, partial [Chitinispirillaceae bacterium]|nr:T9SS type A sorting domain-containing protein [Chitinispirillaceae bacterium]